MDLIFVLIVLYELAGEPMRLAGSLSGTEAGSNQEIRNEQGFDYGS